MLHGKHGTATSSPDDYHLPGLGFTFVAGKAGVSEAANAVYRTALHIAVGYFVALPAHCRRPYARSDFHLIGDGVSAFCAVLRRHALAIMFPP